MRHIRRLARFQPESERARLIADMLGAVALFGLFYLALLLPLFF